MACIGGATMVMGRIPMQDVTPVEQTYYDFLSPTLSAHHLSSLTAVPRLLFDSQEMLPFPDIDKYHVVPLSPLATKIPPTIHLSPPQKHNVFDLVKYKIMSRSDQQLQGSQRLTSSYLPDQRVLKLPRSISVADMHVGSRCRDQETSGSDLRRVLPSVTNLREFAHNQDVSVQKSECSPTQLPTTMFHQRRHVTSNLRDEHVYKEKKLRRKIHYKSYQDFHILSMYQENESLASLNANHPPKPELSDDEGSTTSFADSNSSSGRSSPAPRTPVDQNLPFGSAWPAVEGGNRAHARTVHVIETRQQEPDEVTIENDEETVPMQATVLTIPGKPRLIQIYRSRPSDSSPKQPSSNDMQRPEPTTPVRRKHNQQDQLEISQFSPYDTPASGTPFSDLSRTASEATPTPRNGPLLSVKTNLTMLQQYASTPTRTSSAGSDGTLFSTDERRQGHLADPFGSPLSLNTRGTSNSSPMMQDSPLDLTRADSRKTRIISEKPIFHQIHFKEAYGCRLKDAIAITEKALDALAWNAFHLNSHELASFRSTKQTFGQDNFLLSRLSKVFPHAPRSALSTLTAWLIVDQHFVRLFEPAPPKFPSYIDSLALPGLDRTLSVSPSRTATMIQKPWQNATVNGSRINDLPTYQSMSSPIVPVKIPSKAASLLGIHTDPAGCRSRPFQPLATLPRTSSSSIEAKAQSVHDSVQEMGVKLVKDLIVPMSSPDSASRQRGRSFLHVRGRSTVTGCGNNTDEALDIAIKATWEACRHIVCAD